MEIKGHIVTPRGVVPGVLRGGALIDEVHAEADVPDVFVLPGFIDTHVHGGDGGDAMDGPVGISTMARFHLRHGTTTLLPTTITRPWDEVLEALAAIAAACREGVAGGPCLHGAHLEGPFISPRMLGAQPPHARAPTPERVAQVLALDVVRVVTLAPELPGADEAMAAFAQAGVCISLGHSEADYETAARAMALAAAAGGVCGGTHLFNAMGGLKGREPGLVGALLASDAAFLELILDGHHVHAGSFLLARAAAGERLLLITDAMRGAGLEEGESELGGQRVTIRAGAARLGCGSLAGSVLCMDQALRNAVALGLGLPEAAALTSTRAARYLGLSDRGALVPGLRSDAVVLDVDLAVQQVWLSGVRVA